MNTFNKLINFKKRFEWEMLQYNEKMAMASQLSIYKWIYTCIVGLPFRKQNAWVDMSWGHRNRHVYLGNAKFYFYFRCYLEFCWNWFKQDENQIVITGLWVTLANVLIQQVELYN